jgi:uncharacterized membrane protein YGL010W
MSRTQKRLSKRSLEQWLSEYSVSHQNLINKKIHWMAVPTIFVSILGMGMSLSVWITLVLSAAILYAALDAIIFSDGYLYLDLLISNGSTTYRF